MQRKYCTVPADDAVSEHGFLFISVTQMPVTVTSTTTTTGVTIASTTKGNNELKKQSACQSCVVPVRRYIYYRIEYLYSVRQTKEQILFLNIHHPLQRNPTSAW